VLENVAQMLCEMTAAAESKVDLASNEVVAEMVSQMCAWCGVTAVRCVARDSSVVCVRESKPTRGSAAQPGTFHTPCSWHLAFSCHVHVLW
jgi:hypothetical protein